MDKKDILDVGNPEENCTLRVWAGVDKRLYPCFLSSAMGAARKLMDVVEMVVEMVVEFDQPHSRYVRLSLL